MIVEAKGISKIYSRQGETVTALQDVNLSVGASERIGIAGGSGSGKSTLLRLLSLQEAPTVGELNLFGRSVLEWKEHEKELYRSLQVMFQNSFHSISPRMAVGEFMLEPCVNFGIGTKQEAKERCEWWLSKVGLDTSVWKKYRHELSGGQLQRLVLARMMAVGTELVLFDEPTSALDVCNQARVIELIQNVYEEQPFTYVFVSHDLGVLQTLTDRIIVMKEGTIVETLASKDLGLATHPYTKQLLVASRG